MTKLLSHFKRSLLLRTCFYITLSVSVVLLLMKTPVLAQTILERSEDLHIAHTTDLLATSWMFIAASLVFFMNAGFAMLEAGYCRTNNATNVLAKNLIVFCVAALAYWLVGFGLMFGNSGSENSLFGHTGFAFNIPFPNASDLNPIVDNFSHLQTAWPGRSLAALFFFQLTFAGTTATIVSGAVAERVKFWAFLLFSFILVGFLYPIVGHWIWTDKGWLYDQIRFRDFAGSTVVHSVGGMAGLVGAALLKPRNGQFGYNRKFDNFNEREKQEFPAHQLGFSTLGCLILWLGWFGFNGGSAGHLESVPNVITTTMIAASAGGIFALIFSQGITGKRPTLASIINGILGGLVGITASSGYVNIPAAIIIGGISGIVVLLGEIALKRLKIDDPVGAVPVHLCCGFWGTLAVGLFSTKSSIEYTSLLFHDTKIIQICFQLIGWIVVMGLTCLGSYLAWLIVGNVLCFFEDITKSQSNKYRLSRREITIVRIIGQFIESGRQGIRVSLQDEKRGSDGVFDDI